MHILKVWFAFLCMATAWPELMFNRRSDPFDPTAEAIAWQEDKSWYHNLKNYAAESLRADSSWWAKTLSFIILVQFIMIILLCYLLVHFYA